MQEHFIVIIQQRLNYLIIKVPVSYFSSVEIATTFNYYDAPVMFTQNQIINAIGYVSVFSLLFVLLVYLKSIIKSSWEHNQYLTVDLENTLINCQPILDCFHYQDSWPDVTILHLNEYDLNFEASSFLFNFTFKCSYYLLVAILIATYFEIVNSPVHHYN